MKAHWRITEIMQILWKICIKKHEFHERATKKLDFHQSIVKKIQISSKNYLKIPNFIKVSWEECKLHQRSHILTNTHLVNWSQKKSLILQQMKNKLNFHQRIAKSINFVNRSKKTEKKKRKFIQRTAEKNASFIYRLLKKMWIYQRFRKKMWILP